MHHLDLPSIGLLVQFQWLTESRVFPNTFLFKPLLLNVY